MRSTSSKMMSFLVCLIAIFSALTMVGSSIYSRRLNKQPGLSRPDFLKEFEDNPELYKIAIAVHDYYASEASVPPSMLLNAEDSLEDVFSRLGEDVDDDAIALTRKLDLKLPSEDVLRRYPTAIRTIRDMIFWLLWVMQQQPERSSTESR